MRNKEQVRLGRVERVEELTAEVIYAAERLATEQSIDQRRAFRANLLRSARRYGYAVRSLSLGVR